MEVEILLKKNPFVSNFVLLSQTTTTNINKQQPSSGLSMNSKLIKALESFQRTHVFIITFFFFALNFVI